MILNRKCSVAQAIDYGKVQLQSVSSSARLDSELLLGYVLQESRTWLITHSQQWLTKKAYQVFLQVLARRAQGEPMAYILGCQEFWSIPICCNPTTLIPRSESELLVETVVSLPVSTEKTIKVLDLGTGTGALALAIAKEKPDWQITGVDLIPEAIELARLNQTRLNIGNVNFLCSNWFSALPKQTYDCILANPPYIAENDPHLESLTYEPVTALVAADQGLADIIAIIQQARSWLSPGGYLLLEHGYNQQAGLEQWLRKYNYQHVRQLRDIAGNYRVSYGQVVGRSDLFF